MYYVMTEKKLHHSNTESIYNIHYFIKKATCKIYAKQKFLVL
jgi:hypothetical protein